MKQTNFIENRNHYAGDIQPDENVVIVIGTNPEGRHGKGAAKVAKEQFNAKNGKASGWLSQRAYGIVTKDLRSKQQPSIPAAQIIAEIRQLYIIAEKHPELKFCIAYRNQATEKTLNGYTGAQMVSFFLAAVFAQLDSKKIPGNIYFSEEWLSYIEPNLFKSQQLINQ